MFNTINVNNNQNTRIIAGSKIYKEGSQVLVRVISDKGNGKYEGSVAGIKVNISSQKSLKVGSTFIATISSKDGKIYVTQKNAQPNSSQSFQFNTLQNKQIASLLQQLNLPPDNLSFHLVQQLKQMEMKENPQLLTKLRNLSVKYAGKEKKASEILAILAEKGINATDEEILKLLDELDGDFEKGQNSENTKQFQLMNKINTTKGKWYLIPYEIVNIDNNEIYGNGNLKILINPMEKLKKLNVFCILENCEYLFNLEFENDKCNKINMYVDEMDKKTAIENLGKKLNEIAGCSIDIRWVEKDEIEGTGCGLEEIVKVGGTI